MAGSLTLFLLTFSLSLSDFPSNVSVCGFYLVACFISASRESLMRQHESSVYSIRSICMIFMNVRTTHLPADVSIYVLYCFVFVVFRFWFLICAPHFLVFLLWNKNNKNNWEKIEYNASYSFGVFICRCHICLQLASWLFSTFALLSFLIEICIYYAHFFFIFSPSLDLFRFCIMLETTLTTTTLFFGVAVGRCRCRCLLAQFQFQTLTICFWR